MMAAAETCLSYATYIVSNNEEWQDKIPLNFRSVALYHEIFLTRNYNYDIDNCHYHQCGYNGNFAGRARLCFEAVHNAQICLCCEAQKYDRTLKEILQIYDDARFIQNLGNPVFVDVWNDRKKEVVAYWAEDCDAWGVCDRVTLKPALRENNFSEK
jgi:hypothetical protein